MKFEFDVAEPGATQDSGRLLATKRFPCDFGKLKHRLWRSAGCKKRLVGGCVRRGFCTALSEAPKHECEWDKTVSLCRDAFGLGGFGGWGTCGVVVHERKAMFGEAAEYAMPVACGLGEK